MNYFSHFHVLPNKDNPYYVLGSILPDMLRNAKSDLSSINMLTNQDFKEHIFITKGVMNHLELDRKFHNSPFFFEQTKRISKSIRESEAISMDRYTQFYAHILLELLIDYCLISQDVSAVNKFYNLLSGVKFDMVHCYFENEFPSQDFELFWETFTHFNERKFLLDYDSLLKVIRFSFYVYQKTTKKLIEEREIDEYFLLINQSILPKIQSELKRLFVLLK